MYLTALPADQAEYKSFSPWGLHFEPYMKMDGASGLKKEGKRQVQKNLHYFTLFYPFILEGMLKSAAKRLKMAGGQNGKQGL